MVGVWVQTPQLPKARESRGEAPSAGCCFQFSIKIKHFYAYFGQNSYFKAAAHQFKTYKKQSKHTK